MQKSNPSTIKPPVFPAVLLNKTPEMLENERLLHQKVGMLIADKFCVGKEKAAFPETCTILKHEWKKYEKKLKNQRDCRPSELG